MKVKPSIRVLCANCQVIRRGKKSGGKVIYIYCKNKKHNQRQG